MSGFETPPSATPQPLVVRYEPIAVSDESTVVASYEPDRAREAGYQSEAALEAAFVEQLREQAYEYLPLTSEAALVANLRAQLEALNKITFSDAEWQRFFTEKIASAGANEGEAIHTDSCVEKVTWVRAATSPDLKASDRVR